MLEAILVGIIDAFLLRKTMHFCSGVDKGPVAIPRLAAACDVRRPPQSLSAQHPAFDSREAIPICNTKMIYIYTGHGEGEMEDLGKFELPVLAAVARLRGNAYGVSVMDEVSNRRSVLAKVYLRHNRNGSRSSQSSITG